MTHSKAQPTDRATGATGIVDPQHLEETLESLRGILESLRFGSVSLTVHEGRIVQIDILEKRRIKSA